MSGQTRMSVSLSRRLNPESQVLKSRSLSVLRAWLQHAVPLGLDRVHSMSVSLNCALHINEIASAGVLGGCNSIT